MAIDTFNRFEKKYKISDWQFLALQKEIALHMELDAHNKGGFTYPILNIYYDTADSHLIRSSVQKPAYKEKLRLRAYGVPNHDTLVFAEIKKKNSGSVIKRRSGLKLAEAYSFLGGSSFPILRPYMNGQVLHEIEYILERHSPKPAVFLSYDRRAFFDRENKNLRISFDKNITSRRHDLKLEKGVYGQKLIPEGQWIMEVKTDSALPLWLCRLLSWHKIYPASFSKYGTEYMYFMEENQCSNLYSQAAQSYQSAR